MYFMPEPIYEQPPGIPLIEGNVLAFTGFVLYMFNQFHISEESFFKT